MTTLSEFYEELEKVRKEGDAAKYREYLTKELAMNKMCCGRVSAVEIAAHNELGMFLMAQGKNEDALTHLEEANVLTARLMGTESREYVASLRNLATAQMKNGMVKEADRNARLALSGMKRHGEDETEMYSQTLTDAAMCAMSVGDADRACEYLTEAAALAEKNGDAGISATVYGNLGMCCARAGKKAEAVSALEKAVSFAEQIPNGRQRFGVLYQTLEKLK